MTIDMSQAKKVKERMQKEFNRKLNLLEGKNKSIPSTEKTKNLQSLVAKAKNRAKENNKSD